MPPVSQQSAPPTGQQTGSQNGHQPKFAEQLDRYWLRVTEGLELSQLWKQFQTDARASYRLYRRDFDARLPREERRKDFFHTALEFAWALLEKLSPARRVLLLLAMVLLLFPAGGFTYQSKAGQVEVVQFDFRFFGGFLLFILLMLEVADRVVMKRDLEIARDIQSWLLPAHPPVVPGLAIAFATRPANTVAGDYYDVFQRPAPVSDEPLFMLAVADVAGKSIPAALLMATFQASLRTLSETSQSLAEVVAAMNRYACCNSQSGLRFTTAFIAEYDPASRMLVYINAGHNPPVVLRVSGAIEHLTEGGLPLGILSDAIYGSGSVVLRPGDWLVIFTDGLVEALNYREEEYGETRMLEVLKAGAAGSPAEMLQRMMADLDLFVGTTPQHDDVTCMLVKAA